MDIITTFFLMEILIFIFAISVAIASSRRHRNGTSNNNLTEYYLGTIAARELGTLPKIGYSYDDLRERIERTHKILNEK